MWLRSAFGAAAAGFASYVSAMSKTGVLVARHGPMLANALFLPPGQPPCSAPSPPNPPFSSLVFPRPLSPLRFHRPRFLSCPPSVSPTLFSPSSDLLAQFSSLRPAIGPPHFYHCFTTLLLLAAWCRSLTGVCVCDSL